MLGTRDGGSERIRPLITQSSQLVGWKLLEKPCFNENNLFPDPYCVIADSLNCSRHQRQSHRPFAPINLITNGNGELEDLFVEPVDLTILAEEIFCQLNVTAAKGEPRLLNLGPRRRSHPQNAVKQLGNDRRLATDDWNQLGDVDALIAHPLGVLDQMQQRGYEPQVAGNRSLQCEQRQDPLMDLEVAAVNPVVVIDHEGRQLNVLVLERFHHAVDLLDNEVKRAERLLFEQN